jgi:hypothetical protein
MKTTAELTREQLTDIVERIQGLLYLDLDAAGNEVWDPDKPWDPDTLDGIAQTLAEYGLVPDGKAPAGRSPRGRPAGGARAAPGAGCEGRRGRACRPLAVRLSRTGLGVAAAGPENRVRAVFPRVPQALQ